MTAYRVTEVPALVTTERVPVTGDYSEKIEVTDFELPAGWELESVRKLRLASVQDPACYDSDPAPLRGFVEVVMRKSAGR